MKTTELFSAKERQRRRKKWRIAGIVLLSIVLFVVVWPHIVNNVTFIRFADLYEAVWYFEKLDAKQIEHIIYGDTTAMVFYHPTAGGMHSLCYYQDKGYWTLENGKSQLVDFEIGALSIAKTIRGNDWYIKVSVMGPQENVIYDSVQTDFFCYYTDSGISRYCAVLHPDSEDYEININGETYHIKLKYYGG